VSTLQSNMMMWYSFIVHVALASMQLLHTLAVGCCCNGCCRCLAADGVLACCCMHTCTSYPKWVRCRPATKPSPPAAAAAAAAAVAATAAVAVVQAAGPAIADGRLQVTSKHLLNWVKHCGKDHCCIDQYTFTQHYRLKLPSSARIAQR
jgi:hypothetical protein